MQNRSIEVLDRCLIHASLRFGNSERNYGPTLPLGPMSTPFGTVTMPRIGLHADSEPLRWAFAGS